MMTTQGHSLINVNHLAVMMIMDGKLSQEIDGKLITETTNATHQQKEWSLSMTHIIDVGSVMKAIILARVADGVDP